MVEAAQRDPGPMARLEALVKEPGTMSVIAQRMADGESLRDMAKSWEIPYGKLAEWIIESAERTEIVARASRFWVDAEARSVIGLADNAETTKVGIAHAKLKIDARMRTAGKLFREQYGEASSVSLMVSPDLGMDHDALVLEAARSIAYLLERGAEVAGAKMPPPQLAAPASTERDVTPDKGPI